MQKKDIEQLYTNGWLSPLDYHFGEFMVRLSGSDHPKLFLAAALVSKHTGEGHVCFDLASVAGRPVFDEAQGEIPLTYPELGSWRKVLEESPVVGNPGEFRPLVLDGMHRLYLYRYWDYESNLATFINERSGAVVNTIDRTLLMDGLARYFPQATAGETDWQKVAALTSVAKKLCIISGGPGTGKTTTVTKILALLLEQAKGAQLRIALVAPTGKAATRLEEAIAEARDRLDCPETVKEAIPRESSTIHRLLGSVTGSPYFRHNADNPLTADVVVVDEASMVDLALMAKLTSALPDHARLILLGDKDQLASVEAGAVLGDICDKGTEVFEIVDMSSPARSSGLPARNVVAECIVELRRSYRFGEESGIGELSRAIKEGDGDGALELLRKGTYEDISWKELPHPEALLRALRASVLSAFGRFQSSPTLAEMASEFGRFRILCALRQGPFGAAALNGLIEQVLAEEGLIRRNQWYHGRPIMITRNDYNLRLFNGDIGFALNWSPALTGMLEVKGEKAPRTSDEPALWRETLNESQAGREMRAVFPASNGPPRVFPPARLPEHETVYATTVHKSQGSEFDEVLLILSDRESPVVTRELLYTGVTRARKRLSIWGSENVFRAAVSTRIRRSSGLRDAIWGRRRASCLDQQPR